METTFVNRIASFLFLSFFLIGCETEYKDPYPAYLDRGFIELNNLTKQPQEFVLPNRTKDMSLFPVTRLNLFINNQEIPEDLYMGFMYKTDSSYVHNWDQNVSLLPKSPAEKKIHYYYDCYTRNEVKIKFYTKSAIPIKNLKIEWVLW